MNSPVKTAIIGTGDISHSHAKGFLCHPDLIQCVALCDLNAESRRNLAGKLGGHPQEFSDWKTMYAKMGDGLEAVVICLPHHVHAPAILDACAAGKSILCEKPMCISREEARQIIAAVKASGVLYMSAHNQLFMPAFAKACELVDSGLVGKVRWIKSQDCFVMNPGMLKDAWRSIAQTQGGGELIDTGYHPTYRLLHIAKSKPVAVRATMGRFGVHIQGEDTASVQVRFENGVIGEILTSWAMKNPHGTYEIHVIGDKGQVFGSGADLFSMPNDAAEPTRIPIDNAESETFVSQIAHFAKAIRNQTRPLHSVEEGFAVLDVILSATENAEGWQSTAQFS